MAIDAKELRIGNMVMFMGREIFVHGGTIQDLERDNAVQSQYDPIPLTTEILLKCGFEKRDDGYYIKDLKNARMSIGFYAGVSDKMTLFQMQGLSYDNTKEFKIHFGVNHPSSLHQLQNLYYALTGKEIEINL